jgi:hypothetical protein
MFVPLHTKSAHSPGYGTACVDELVRRASKHGYPALALADVENLYGQVAFHHAARRLGVKPITGVELRSGYRPGTLGSKRRRLVLLARDRTGYESLCRIITRRRAADRPRDDDPLRCLDAEPCGVFFLSDDASTIRDLLRAGVPHSDVRCLLIRPGGGAPPAGVLAVADTDVVMADPADRHLHVLQMAIHQRRRCSTVTDAEPPERSLPAPEAVRRLFADAPQALAESRRLAEACCFDLSTMPRVLPALECPDGEIADAYLERTCRQRFDDGRRQGTWQGPIYDERLGKELALLRELGFASYFLIVAEIAGRARQEGMAVAGRGSAAGSLVAHVLGITTIDPVAHGLYFERFLHPERRELPDIDLDLPSDRRDELIDWVFRRFGRERVAVVSAHQTFARRAALREGLKALGMPLAEVERFCDRLPADELEPALAPLPFHFLPDLYRAAVPLLGRLVGKFQHLSVHPGGVVIADAPLDRYVPLELAPKGVVVTQYDMHALAKVGLVKIDLLGNRALSAVQEALRWVGEPAEVADGDPATVRLLHEARTVGCFQIETPALRAVLRRLPVRGERDLVAALAIVRPGPASGEAKAAFLRRANAAEPAHPPHPRLAEALRDTYGMMLYEEDLMTAIAALTGWSLGRADVFRAALLAAQGDAAVMARLQQQFTAGARRTGLTDGEALSFWQILARFVAYSFNKAHATSYADLAWQTAALKAHYPVAFACAVLNSYGGLYPLRTLAADFARHGVRLLPPHVNHSQARCTVESGAVRIGLSSVKHLTKKNRLTLLEKRPFGNFRDVLQRLPFSYRELESLVLCGACDGLSPLTPEDYPFAHEALLARLKTDRRVQALEGPAPRPPEVVSGATAKQWQTYRALVRIRNELKVQWLTLSVPPRPARPPPWPGVMVAPNRRPPTATLPLKVLSWTIRVPIFKTPPPRARLPAAPCAWLVDRVQPTSVRVPAFSMPPPLSARPLVIVKRSIPAVTPAAMLNTRLWLLPLIVSWSAPSPTMSRLALIANSPLVKVMVWPTRLASKTIMSPSPAPRMASRSEPEPLSCVFSTVYVLSRVRHSSISSRGSKTRGRRVHWRPAQRAARVRSIPARSHLSNEKVIGQTSSCDSVCDFGRKPLPGRADPAPGVASPCTEKSRTRTHGHFQPGMALPGGA